MCLVYVERFNPMSIIRKYHNHTLQTNPRQCDEETPNIYSNKTPGRKLKQSNQPSLSRQDDRKTRKDTKLCISKQRLNTEPHKHCEVHKRINQHQ